MVMGAEVRRRRGWCGDGSRGEEEEGMVVW